MRQATQVFKYLGRQNNRQQDGLEDDWVHRTKRIRTVIKKLRCRETNLLTATSVVEEGVDVDSCSFIMSFDGLKTVKSYIQMKGRARQKNAAFFVFVDRAAWAISQPLSLDDAQMVESTIHHFIAGNEGKIAADSLPSLCNNAISDHSFASDEEAAIHHGRYSTNMSSVDLSSSKSLLNRYALSVPLEANCRSSKEATTLHMPIYLDNKLILPSHLPPNVREVTLPIILHGESKKKKQSLLALAACVRLHKLGLLNDRLLPLSMSDMKEWLLGKIVVKLPSCNHPRQRNYAFQSTAYIYGICLSGDRFDLEEKKLGSSGMQLAFISLALLPEDLPVYSFTHKQLGLIQCKLTFCRVAVLSKEEWKALSSFYEIIFNARWRKQRKKTTRFRFNMLANPDQVIAPYVIGCLKASGEIDLVLIQKTIYESSRPLSIREKATQTDSMDGPRVWSPSYSVGVSYIVQGPSGKCGDDIFPTDEYESFKDYYSKKYNITISSIGKMYLARRRWEFPYTSMSKQAECYGDENANVLLPEVVELPQELCAENNMADPLILLHSIMLPQLLYELERFITAKAFIEHCSRNLPSLSSCLCEVNPDCVMEALTAASCCVDDNYDRMEWRKYPTFFVVSCHLNVHKLTLIASLSVGDGVLKLIHTDALLKWEYTSYLHEGYLSMLRSSKFIFVIIIACQKHKT